MAYIVLVENEHSEWDDLTGVRYHFPNRYLTRISEGDKFIYYKGATRDHGPHYFGVGEVAEITQENGNPTNYYAVLTNYIQFVNLIDFKQDGEYLEETNRRLNYFRQNSVRPVSVEVFRNIVGLAGLEIDNDEAEVREVIINNNQIPDVQNAVVQFAENELMRETVINPLQNGLRNKTNREHTYSRNSKRIGNRAERIVFDHLLSKQELNGISNVRWLARENITPGYDLEYTDANNVHKCVEVKGTTAGSFSNIIITTNEYEEGIEQGENYYLYLVARCMTNNPIIQIINDPFNREDLDFQPASYQVVRIGNE